MKFYVWHSGHEAGQPGDRATVDVAVVFKLPGDREVYIKRIERHLSQCFEGLWGLPVNITRGSEDEADASTAVGA